MHADRSVRAVAMFEAAKGVLVLLLATGALSLLNPGVQHAMAQLVEQIDMHWSMHMPAMLLSDNGLLSAGNLVWVAALAGLYALVRFVEAYGLWRERLWAEWFAAISGAIYIPFELYEILAKTEVLAAFALLINVVVVGVMVRVLRQRLRARTSER